MLCVNLWPDRLSTLFLLLHQCHCHDQLHHRVMLFAYAGDSDSLERPAGARCDSPAAGRDFLLRCVQQQDTSARVSPLTLSPRMHVIVQLQAYRVKLLVDKQ